MFSQGPDVLHNQFRLTKNPGVEALQNKIFFRFGIQGHQEGVIDIAIPISFNSGDFSRRVESFGGNKRGIQSFTSDVL